MKKICFCQQNKGVGLIEILVAIAIIGLILTSLAGLGNFILKINQQNKQSVIAAFLAQEAIEAIRAIKEENWNLIANLTDSNPYHPIKAGSPLKWVLTAGAETINGLTRQITVSPVYRDTNDNIITSGGILDPETKKITAVVSWNDNGRNYQTPIVYYLTNWQP